MLRSVATTELTPCFLEKFLHLSLHLRTILDIRPHPSLQDRVGSFSLDYASDDFRRNLVVWAVESDRADGIFCLGLSRHDIAHTSGMVRIGLFPGLVLAIAALLELFAAAARTGIIAAIHARLFARWSMAAALAPRTPLPQIRRPQIRCPQIVLVGDGMILVPFSTELLVVLRVFQPCVEFREPLPYQFAGNQKVERTSSTSGSCGTCKMNWRAGSIPSVEKLKRTDWRSKPLMSRSSSRFRKSRHVCTA